MENENNKLFSQNQELLNYNNNLREEIQNIRSEQSAGLNIEQTELHRYDEIKCISVNDLKYKNIKTLSRLKTKNRVLRMI